MGISWGYHGDIMGISWDSGLEPTMLNMGVSENEVFPARTIKIAHVFLERSSHGFWVISLFWDKPKDQKFLDKAHSLW